MDFRVLNSLAGLPAGAVIVSAFFEGDTLADAPELRSIGGDGFAQMQERGEIRSDLYHIAFIPPNTDTPGLLLVGSGKQAEYTPLYAARVSGTAAKYLAVRGYTDAVFVDRCLHRPFDAGYGIAVGSIYGAYDAGLKKSRRPENRRLANIGMFVRDNADSYNEGLRVGRIVGDSSNVARDLVNTPPNELTPSYFAEQVRTLAENCGLDCDVVDEQGLREAGMRTLLAVASGSDEPPRLIALRYGDKQAKASLTLVGKGLTFDSGGLSLKTAQGMETMKSDMGGAAAVVGGMIAIARLGIPDLSVTAYVGATENMPGGSAMRPGDVVTALNGVTIEILNTDAEGRLVLADLLSYAVQNGSTHIVDFATLTGGAVVALGSASSLAAGRPDDWVSRVVDAANAGLERAWAMPLHQEYRRAMDSEIADIKNTGGRDASALTASAFLGDFVGEARWAHIDIAGTAFSGETLAYAPKGATGFGVGTIVALARSMSHEADGRDG